MSISQNQERINNLLDVWTIVFNFCAKDTLASVVRVRKLWEELAMRALWRALPTAEPLFKLLGDMERLGAVDWGSWVCVLHE